MKNTILDVEAAIAALFDFALDFQSNPEQIAKVRSQFMGAIQDADKAIEEQDLEKALSYEHSVVAIASIEILTAALNRFALEVPTKDLGVLAEQVNDAIDDVPAPTAKKKKSHKPVEDSSQDETAIA